MAHAAGKSDEVFEIDDAGDGEFEEQEGPAPEKKELKAGTGYGE